MAWRKVNRTLKAYIAYQLEKMRNRLSMNVQTCVNVSKCSLILCFLHVVLIVQCSGYKQFPLPSTNPDNPTPMQCNNKQVVGQIKSPKKMSGDLRCRRSTGDKYWQNVPFLIFFASALSTNNIMKKWTSVYNRAKQYKRLENLV